MEKTRVKNGERYWFVDDECKSIHTYETDIELDRRRFNLGNYFTTKEEAEAMAKKIRKVLKGADVVEMPSEEDIIKAARERAERHSIAEAELHKGLGDLYGYSRIENAEIASFGAGAEWLKEQLTKEE